MGNTSTTKTNTKAGAKKDFDKAFDAAVKNSGKAAPPKEEAKTEPKAKAVAESKEETPKKSAPVELNVVKEEQAAVVVEEITPQSQEEKLESQDRVAKALNPIPSLYLVYYDGDLSLTTDLGTHIRDGLMGDLEPDEAKEALSKIKMAQLVDNSVVTGDGDEIEWEEAEDHFEVEVAKWTLGSRSESQPEEDDEDLEDLEDEEEGEED